MPKLKYVLDTHAFLWAALEDERLSPKAMRAVSCTPYEQLAISDLTLQEIGLLLHTGRISFEGRPATVLAGLLEHVTVVPVSLDIAIMAPSLPLPHGDQFDRIITATAKVHKIPLVSKDANIANSGCVCTIW